MEVEGLQAQLRAAEERGEGLARAAREADTLRARMADLEAAAASAGQWQEAYGQLQQQLHSAQVHMLLLPLGWLCQPAASCAAGSECGFSMAMALWQGHPEEVARSTCSPGSDTLHD